MGLKPICRHANCTCVAQPGKRGLCYACHADLAIRNLYPVDPRCGRSGPPVAEPTAEDVERQIAEQRATMPQGKPRV